MRKYLKIVSWEIIWAWISTFNSTNSSAKSSRKPEPTSSSSNNPSKKSDLLSIKNNSSKSTVLGSSNISTKKLDSFYHKKLWIKSTKSYPLNTKTWTQGCKMQTPWISGAISSRSTTSCRLTLHKFYSKLQFKRKAFHSRTQKSLSSPKRISSSPNITSVSSPMRKSRTTSSTSWRVDTKNCRTDWPRSRSRRNTGSSSLSSTRVTYLSSQTNNKQRAFTTSSKDSRKTGISIMFQC